MLDGAFDSLLGMSQAGGMIATGVGGHDGNVGRYQVGVDVLTQAHTELLGGVLDASGQARDRERAHAAGGEQRRHPVGADPLVAARKPAIRAAATTAITNCGQ